MSYTLTLNERKLIKECIEGENIGYDLKSYDILDMVPNDGRWVVTLQNIKLEGKHMLSEDGNIDGQPIPKIIAPSTLPHAGYIIAL